MCSDVLYNSFPEVFLILRARRHIIINVHRSLWAGQFSQYSDWLRAGRSGDRIPVEARSSAPIHAGPRVHPVYFSMGTGSFPGVKSGRGVTLTTHHLLVPWSWKSRAIPLLPLWTVRPVQSLSACTRVHFIYKCQVPVILVPS